MTIWTATPPKEPGWVYVRVVGHTEWRIGSISSAGLWIDGRLRFAPFTPPLEWGPRVPAPEQIEQAKLMVELAIGQPMNHAEHYLRSALAALEGR